MDRAKKRNLLTLAFLVLIIVLTLVVGIFVRGYRLDLDNRSLQPTGILSATSTPEGAQVWLNGKLKTATDQTMVLPPDEYQIEIKKPGFTAWKKTITIEKEVVAETNAYLFPIAPDLKALTFTGANKPQVSPDGTKLVYFVTSEEEQEKDKSKGLEIDNIVPNSSSSTGTETEATTTALPKEIKTGLWLISLTERPLGQSFQTRILVKLTADFDFDNAAIRWSSDSRKIIMTTPSSKENKTYFLLDANQSYDFTTPPLISEREAQALKTLTEWEEQETLSFQQLFNKLPEKLQDNLNDNATGLSFSPDELKILYQAKKDFNLPEKLISKQIIGASTQKETRQLKAGFWYVYDIKEDKNFLVLENKDIKISWFPTSQHLLLIKEAASIEVVEYDGHNQTTIYSGPFENGYVFPFPSGKQLLILTSLNNSRSPDLYSISLE
jgi:hypothetical protein